MGALYIILSLIILLFSSLCLLAHVLKSFLQKKGLDVSFSLSGLFSLGNLNIRILGKHLEKYENIGSFELFLSKVAVRVQSWKLKIILDEGECLCFITNGSHAQAKRRETSQLRRQSPHHTQDHDQNTSRKTKAVNDSSVGIIRNLMLIVTIQIISRIISFELENIRLQFYMADCECTNGGERRGGRSPVSKISQDGKCRECGAEVKYGLSSRLEIKSLSILPKAYLGGIMVSFQLDNPTLYLAPLPNSFSEKRCQAFYLDSNNTYKTMSSSPSNKPSILRYILEQFRTATGKADPNKSQSPHPPTSYYPPLLHIKDNVSVSLKLMHSMSGSDIRVCILRNVNIEMNQLWFTAVPEILCELIYVFHRAGSICNRSGDQHHPGSRKGRPPRMLDPSIIIQSDPIIKLSPKYQLLSNAMLPASQTPSAPPSSQNVSSSSPFGRLEDNISRTKHKLIMNENLDRQLQISCKVTQPSLIFCDNTQSGSGFEILFHELEAHFIIQYFVEYLQSNLKLYNQDEDFCIPSSESPSDTSVMAADGRYRDHHDSDLNKKTRKSLKLIFGSKLIFGNSICHLGSKEDNSPSLGHKPMQNTIRDGEFAFDRMFVIEHYKSIVQVSDNNFVKLYFKSSIQRMSGVWRENGFYQNLTQLLQLTKFQKYLSKIQVQAEGRDNAVSSSPPNGEDHSGKPSIWQESDEIPKIPPRTELEDDDILKSDFLIKNNKYLKEIMTIKDFAVYLLFYLEIKEISIQTNDIYCFNDEINHCLGKKPESNLHCENCLTESFGPKDRYKWKTDFESKSDTSIGTDIHDRDQKDDIRFIILKISNLKMCNTSLNRSFSMFFSDMDLYGTDEFVDLEDISVKYFPDQRSSDEDFFDPQKVSVYRYGCFDQRTQTIAFRPSQRAVDKIHLVKLSEAIVVSPWDQKRISLRFKGAEGDLRTCYVPLYLYILGCFSTDCLALKRKNLSKIYYGVNNQFEDNFDFYCRLRSSYWERLGQIKKDLREKMAGLDLPGWPGGTDLVDCWTVPDLILSKEGSLKYTWYFDFEDVSVSFLGSFKLLISKLSLYRCNEHGNYDILMSQVKIFDPFGISILSSNSVRMRSDIPFKSLKIKSPICLKKQLRRILDLSENGDLLLLSILGNQKNPEENLKDIQEGRICFESKRFVLEIDQLDLQLFVNCPYLESLTRYIYQYVYITFYQLFHPPLIIRMGKLLSFSRQHPITFSCNNIFELAVAKTTLSLSSLADFMLLPQEGHASPPSGCFALKTRTGILSRDDSSIQYSLRLENLPTQRPKVGLNSLSSLPISETKFNHLRLSVRTKHTSNSRSFCNDRECYKIPNYLTNCPSSEETFLINPEYNPINIFISLVGLSVNLFSHLSLSKKSNKVPILPRKEISLNNENIVIDFRRSYHWIDHSNVGTDIYLDLEDSYGGNYSRGSKETALLPELSSNVKISVYSRLKTCICISNVSSLKTLELLTPLLDLIKRCPSFKESITHGDKLPPLNGYKNVTVSRNILLFSFSSSDRMSFSLAPYIHLHSQNLREMNNSSVFIHLPKAELGFKKSNNPLGGKSLDGCGGLSGRLETASLLLREGVVVGLVSKEIFAPLAKRKRQSSAPFVDPVQLKYSLKSALVSLSRLRVSLERSPRKGFEAKLAVDGLDKESIAERLLGGDPGRPDTPQTVVPLTLNLDLERFVQFSTILEAFLDERNFEGVSLLYCEGCQQLKPTKLSEERPPHRTARAEASPEPETSSGQEGAAQPEENFSLEVSLNNINLRYEIFGLLVRRVWLSLDRFDSELTRLVLGVSEAQLIAECFPYRLSQLAKPSQSFKLLRGSSVQISSNFSGKTKMLEIARIRSVYFQAASGDPVLLALGTPQISLSMLNLIYLDTLLKLFRALKSKSEGVAPSKKESKGQAWPRGLGSAIPLIPAKKLNIQVDEIMVNAHCLGPTCREVVLRRDDRKIRLGASFSARVEKSSWMPDQDVQDDFLCHVIEQNPINSTLTLTDEPEDANEDCSILLGNGSCQTFCLECRYHLNKPLIYSSRIFNEKKTGTSGQLEKVFRKYCNDYLHNLDEYVISDKYHKSSFEMVQEYRKICQYTENNVSIPLEYGQILEDMILSELGCKARRASTDHIYFSRNFGQIIFRIPRIDCSVGIYDCSRKFEFMIKMFPVSVDIFLSNRLIWDLFEGTAGRHSVAAVSAAEESSSMKERDGQRSSPPLNVVRRTSENQYSSSSAHLDSQSSLPESCSPRLSSETPGILEGTEESTAGSSSRNKERRADNLESSQEILKTTPVFVSVRIQTGRPSTQLKMYSSQVSLYIDCNRVRSISEILHSFEFRNVNMSRTSQQPSPESQSAHSQLSLLASSGVASANCLHPLSVSSFSVNSVTGGSLPPPIYYSNHLSVPAVSSTSSSNQAASGELSQNTGSQLATQGHHHHSLSALTVSKTPSVLSFSNLYDQKHSQGQRLDILSVLNLNSRAKEKTSPSSLGLNPKRMLFSGDLTDKNVSNMLKFEIDRYLADNPLFYTVVDDVQYQVGGDSGPVCQYKLQIECILDQLNVDMLIMNRGFSKFLSKDINFIMFSNSSPSNSTIIEFDTSFIHLSANKDFFQSSSGSNVSMASSNGISSSAQGHSGLLNPGGHIQSCQSGSSGHNSTHGAAGPATGGGLNWSLAVSAPTAENGHVSVSQEEVSIIQPMYIDGHTSQGHGHVLSIRVNMRQVRLLEVYNIRILESVVIRVHPIRVNITQYLTSCYYNIFFSPSSSGQQPTLGSFQTGVNSQSLSGMPPNVEGEASLSSVQEEQEHGEGESGVLSSEPFPHSSSSNAGSHTALAATPDNERSSFLAFPSQQTNSPSKNVLYFNYLRISSILVEVTYRGSVSLNKVLLELSSFTQRRKHRSVKEMVDKYISFLRRQAARPVISYTFKQLRHSLLPKHFKSHKRSSNFNSHYNDIVQDNSHSASQTNSHNRSSILNSSYQDLLAESKHDGSHLLPSSGNRNANYSHSKPNGDEDTTVVATLSSRKSQTGNCSKNDSEYNKFRLIFGNQLLI